MMNSRLQEGARDMNDGGGGAAQNECALYDFIPDGGESQMKATPMPRAESAGV